MTLLHVRDLCAGYGQVRVLHNLDLDVEAGSVVVLLGANGAGKTTTLKALTGQIPSTGSVELAGASIGHSRPEVIVKRGVSLVPEGRGVFSELTVQENLLAGAYVRSHRGIQAELEDWFTLFPNLAERRNQKAGTLSGGEQQMLAVTRALMARPRILLLDEPSLGLAPVIVTNLFEKLRRINVEHGTAMLIVEQNANIALSIATKGYVLERGHIVKSGDAASLRGDDAIRLAYLGV